MIDELVEIRVASWPARRPSLTPCLGHGIVEARGGPVAFGRGDCFVVDAGTLRVCTDCDGGRRAPDGAAPCRRG